MGFLQKIWLIGVLVWVLTDCSGALRGQTVLAAEDEKLLAAAGVKSDSASLLHFFRQRTLSPQDQAKLTQRVRRLGDRSYRVRHRAFNDLQVAGRMAVTPLQAALKDKDLEIARRAELCLERIQQNRDAELATAAARLVMRSRPAGAAEVLLNYLPFANDESVIEAVQAALNVVAVPDGKPANALVSALQDRQPTKRAAAGEALTRAETAAMRRATRKLLTDAEPVVRLQVALAFVDARDKRGIPVLIAALADLPRDKAWPAEEVLLRLAGKEAPQVALGGDVPAVKVRDAWQGWWDKCAAQLDLAKLHAVPRQLGYTLVVQLDNNVGRGGLNGRVLELDRNGKARWQVENIRYPLDAQFLSPGRVLVAEYLDQRVTERNRKGEIVWQKRVNLPIACQRLPNGHTFIATRNQLLDVDPKGKEKVLYNQVDFSISGAQRLRNGEMYVVTNQGQLTRLDPNGKAIKSFQVGQVYFFGGLDVLPGGRVLVPEYRNHRVAEYDAQGKLVWHAESPFPTSAVRLPNGHTLVANMANQQVVELNREGKVVWRHAVEGRPFRARRR